jgi:hypothetical protein
VLYRRQDLDITVPVLTWDSADGFQRPCYLLLTA